MSLNRSEQLLFDYVEKHPEERQYWLHKVRHVAELCASLHASADQLEGDLWRYFAERATVIPLFQDFVRSQGGLRRTSMRNLAEYLLRVWVAPKVKPKTVTSESSDV